MNDDNAEKVYHRLLIDHFVSPSCTIWWLSYRVVGRSDGPYNRRVETDLNHREGAIPVVNSSVAPSKEHLDALLSTRGRNAPGSALSDPRLSAGYISFIYGFPDMDS